MSVPSAPGLAVLHAVRVMGFAPTDRVVVRTGLPAEEVRTHLLDAEAVGHVTRSTFADQTGWSLTEAGKVEGERLLAAELDASGHGPVVRAVLDGFGPLNDLVAAACTRWQLTDLGLAQPPAVLDDVLADLTRAAVGLARIEARLTAGLARFAGYHERFTTAAGLARHDTAWITAMDRDSAHRVWFELHEDLLATLGRSR